jgi:tetratricopeptide (TPR) repeat protein
MSALLIALALAAPERVVVVARPVEPPGLLERLGKRMAAATRRLYERDDEGVARGNALLAQDDAQGALAEYDKARARLPEDPGVAFDRATALLKVDAKLAPEAASEAARALQRGGPALKPKAAYQMALALEGMGQADDALRQYGAALALDPDDVDSKVNLELLLRTEEQRRKSPAGQPRPNQAAQQGEQQKPEPQKGEAQRKQQESPAQKPTQGQEPQPQQPDPANPQQSASQQPDKQREKADPKAGSEKPVDRTEAERLLDALRASEKNLQIWRFAKKKTEVRKRSDLEKDW